MSEKTCMVETNKGLDIIFELINCKQILNLNKVLNES